MDFIEAKLEINGGHVFATVAHKEVVHVHATGHASGDRVCNAVDLKAKEGDGEDAALGHPPTPGRVGWKGQCRSEPESVGLKESWRRRWVNGL